jgi:hypothetical protein
VATSSPTRRLGSTAAWPVVARAQQGERLRRIGALMSYDENDPISQARAVTFREALARLGWIEGRNLPIDSRFAGIDTNRANEAAAERILPSNASCWPVTLAAMAGIRSGACPIALEGFFSCDAGHRHGLKIDRRLLYRTCSSGAINLPPPRFRRRCPALYDN